MDFRRAAETMFLMLKPGGLAFHYVDFVDHSVYGPQSTRHYWSFLEEDEWSGHTNRLRVGEMQQILTDVGFEIVAIEPQTEALPSDLRERFSDRFKQMPLSELEVIRAGIVIRRPS